MYHELTSPLVCSHFVFNHRKMKKNFDLEYLAAWGLTFLFVGLGTYHYINIHKQQQIKRQQILKNLDQGFKEDLASHQTDWDKIRGDVRKAYRKLKSEHHNGTFQEA